MKLKGIIDISPEHPSYTAAAEAIQRYYDAQKAGRPPAELDRLRQEAELLIQTTTNFLSKGIAGPDSESS